ILYYCQVHDLGDGIIELTWVVHNFSIRKDIVFEHLNAPWGGTRVSRLPYHYIAMPDGTLKTREELPKTSSISVRKTGGWNISCANQRDDSPSLALVFGRDKHLEEELRKMKQGKPYCQYRESLYRDWRPGKSSYKTAWKDWQTRPGNTFRNYDVAVIVPKFRLAPGTSIWYRSFLVVNRKDRAIQLAKRLVSEVDYGLLQFSANSTPMIKVTLPGGSRSFELYAYPVRGSLPVFLIEDTRTGKQVVTTDPYIFVPKEKLNFGLPQSHPLHDYYNRAIGYSIDRHHARWKHLLGFAPVRKPAQGRWEKLSRLAGNMFPSRSEYEVDWAADYHVDVWCKF
ncbi:MAG: hypothetical protein D6820_04210, partial [Lentisphaerae bacterium]